ncbi:PAS domain-containing sensor histidine kinase [Flavitalea sp.]|nr:PAS domain-containing protein [Flavitalea sp.]
MANGKDDMIFSFAPNFARFILENHLEEYLRREVSFSRSMNIPLWEQFKDSRVEDVVANSRHYYTEFLEGIANNSTWQNINKWVNQYRQDLLGHVNRAQISAEDILLTHAARRKTLLSFLGDFTNDPTLIIQIIGELDTLFTRYNILAAQNFIEQLNQKVLEEKSIKDKLFTTSPGYYYLHDIPGDTQILPAEKLFFELGYNRYEFAGNNKFFRQIVHPEDLANADHYIMSLANMQEGEVRFFEYRLRNSKGEYRWMRNYETAYKRDSEGFPTQLLGVAFDITQERLYAEELQAKEEALLEAQNLANIGTFTWDILDNKICAFSKDLASLGLQAGSSFEEIMTNVHPSDKIQVIQMFNKAINGTRPYECEYRCTVNNRERILWSKGKVKFIDEKPAQLNATIMDVTDKHQMIRKLQRSEELYKQAQALNRIGNWSWNISSDRVQWSDELFNIYGLPAQSEQITFDRYLSFVHPDDREARSAGIQEQINNPGHREYYFRIKTPDGAEKILYGQSEVLLNEDELPFKMIGTCQDVTAQKTLEKTLYDRTIQLQKSNASLKVFAYISSHDLKEPLRKISLFGDRLRMLNESRLDEQSTNILKTIIQSSLRLQQMIDEILSVSKINTDEHFEHTSLTEILEDVLMNIEPQIEEKAAVINYEPLPYAFVNPIQIRQLFTNLISNSLKFSRPKTPPTINITTDFPSIKEITEAGLENSKRYLRIRFSDNGIGFLNDYAEKIFAIFQRLHDKSTYKGTGIGLAICREIVAHHGGVISAKGAPQQGATFTVILPMQ